MIGEFAEGSFLDSIDVREGILFKFSVRLAIEEVWCFPTQACYTSWMAQYWCFMLFVILAML